MKLATLLLTSAALVAGGMVQAAQPARAPVVVDHATKAGEVENDGSTALHWAAYNEDVAAAKALIAAGADINAKTRYGATPMALAAENGNTEIIKALLDAGVSVEDPNPEGQTTLMVVARNGNVEAAKMLLDKGANPNNREQWRGQTALMWAAANHQADMIRLLTSRGADPNLRAWENPSEIRNTAEPRPKDVFRGGLTAANYAAREGCIECIAALKEGGADLDMPDVDGLTPLIYALSNMHWDTAKALIENGADVNRWDLYGRTPLFAAVSMSVTPDGQGRPDVPTADATAPETIATMLLERGANPNMQLKIGLPYRMVVEDRGSGPPAGATPLWFAAQDGDWDMIQVLLKFGADPTLATNSGSLPLLVSFTDVGRGKPGSGVLRRTKTEQDAIRSLQAMLDGGVDPNMKDANGRAAIHIAAQGGNDQVVTILAQHGADLQIKDATGRTPLDYAAGTNLPPRPAQAAGRGGGGGGGGGFGAGAQPAPAPKESTVALLQKLLSGGPVASAATTPQP